jgi:uncharacterized protein YcfJ
LPLLAEGAPEALSPAAATAAAPAALSGTAAADAPALPEATAADVTITPSTDAVAAPVEVPKEVLATPGKAKAEEPVSRFRTGNFILGFIGGALLGGAAGVLFFSQDASGGIDQDKLKVAATAGVLGGGLLGGTVAVMLGATTPEEARPPQVEGRRPTPMLVASVKF